MRRLCGLWLLLGFLLLGLWACGTAWSYTQDTSIVLHDNDRDTLPNPAGHPASDDYCKIAVSDRYAVWVDEASSTDTYDRIYYYDLQADSDSDGIPDWLKLNPRPAATLLTPAGGSYHRRNPDIYGSYVVYEVWSGSTSTIGYATISAGEQSTNIGTGVAPHIGKYGSTYFVAWQNGTTVQYRALPSGTTYSFASCSASDIGYQWLVYKTATGISRTDLSLYSSNPTNSEAVPGTNASSTLPCTDHSGDYLGYLQYIGGAMLNRLYAVSHSDLNTPILVNGTADQEGHESYAIASKRPTISNGVIYWQWYIDGNHGLGIGAADIATTKTYLYLGSDHRAKVQSEVKPSPGSSWINWLSVTSSGDRIGFYWRNGSTDVATPGILPLRTNLVDGLGLAAIGEHPLILYKTDGSGNKIWHSWNVKVFVRNVSPYSWTTSNVRLKVKAKTQDSWPGHGSSPWALRENWAASSQYHYPSSSTPKQGVATFSWTIGPDSGYPGPTSAGRYAFDWTIQYYNGSTWSELSKCWPGGSEGPSTVDLLKVRQDLSFRSFLDVLEGDLSDYIEACAYHWREEGLPQIVSGYGDGTFRPDNGVTRAQMCVYVMRAEKVPADYEAPHPGDPGFDPDFGIDCSDVDWDYWAYDAIYWCYEAGIVHGYGDGTFRPENPVTRGTACVYLRRALGGGDGDYVPSGGYFYTDVTTSHACHDAIYWMAEQKHLKDRYPGPTFTPDRTIARDEMCEFVTYGYCLTMPTQNMATPW